MNKIIHFTEKFDSLISMLTNNSFKICYCLEDFSVNGSFKSRAAHPMVCFSFFKSNEKTESSYGNYGIGFSENWAIQKKIFPVIYIEQNNQLSNALNNLLIARRSEKLNTKLSTSILLIKCYTKNLIGKNKNQGVDNFNFKNENEWRFVPTKNEIGNNLISINRKPYENKKTHYNKLISNYFLKFKKTEVQVVYVENDEEKFIIHKKFKIELNKISINK